MVESQSDTPSGSWRRIEWTYDAFGRRIQQVTSIWTNNAWFVVENLKFVSDPMLFGRHIVELNGTNNTLVRSYAWGIDLSGSLSGAGGVGGLTWVTLHTASGHASGTHFTCYDGNGNIVALVSVTSGDVTARYEYGPFGEPIRVSGPAAALNPFHFSTKRADSTTDLLLYEYRAYHAGTGRWLNTDPIEEQGGNNLYNFTGNAPSDSIDTDGRLTGTKCSLCGQWYQGYHKCPGPQAPPPLPAPAGKGPVEVCIRPLQALKQCTIIVHCYLDLGAGEAWAYDNKGVHAEPWPDSPKKRCVNALCPTSVTVQDLRKRIDEARSSGKWDGEDYDVLRHNCCHWVDSVLKALGCEGMEKHFPPYRLPTRPSSY